MNVTNALRVLFRMCTSPAYRLIRMRGVFDPDFYLHRLRQQGLEIHSRELLFHYSKRTGDDYLCNELRDGKWRSLAEPMLFFDTAYYLLNYFPDGLKVNPLYHYLKWGWKEGLQPGPFFDAEYYRASSDWERGDPLTHFCRFRQHEGDVPSLVWDKGYYLDNNPACEALRNGVFREYKDRAAARGKSPAPMFDPSFYLATLLPAEREKAAVDPLSHYLTSEQGQGRDVPMPAADFDAVYYKERLSGADFSKGVLHHFLTEGVFLGVFTMPCMEKIKNPRKISILVPVYNPEPRVLNNCIRSVLFQLYPYWELCLADDCSANPEVRKSLQYWADQDKRIKVVFLASNGGIARATNKAAELASGDYLGFLDNDDELTRDCLFKTMLTLEQTGADVLYSDEALIGDDGSRLSLFRKPDFNQSLLLSHNYITHFVVIKTSLFTDVGQLDPACDGAQDFDLLLKLSEKAERIVHIPEILYHWRASETSTSINHEQKNYAHEAGKTALENAMRRRKIDAAVTDGVHKYFYQLEHRPKNNSAVHVFIWFVDETRLETFVNSVLPHLVEAENCINLQFSLVTPLQVDSETLSLPDGDENMEILVVASGCSKYEALLTTLQNSDSEYVLLLDSAVSSVSKGWVGKLLQGFYDPATVLVSGRCLFDGEDGVSYALPETGNNSLHYYRSFLQFHSLHVNWILCTQDSLCGVEEICMIKKEPLISCLEDGQSMKKSPLALADFSLQVAGKGGRCVYHPEAAADFLQPQTAPVSSADSLELQKFQSKWGDRILQVFTFANSERFTDAGLVKEDVFNWVRGRV